MKQRSVLRLVLIAAASSTACGGDDFPPARDAGIRDGGPVDGGPSPRVPDTFVQGMEGFSLALRATAPVMPLAERLRDESLTIDDFPETKTLFDAAIRAELDGRLHESDCTTFGEVDEGSMGATLDRSGCVLAYGGTEVSTESESDSILTVQPRNEGRWRFRERLRVGERLWDLDVSLRVGGDCSPTSTTCMCPAGSECGVDMTSWGAGFSSQEAGSPEFRASGELIFREDGSMEVRQAGFSPQPRTYSAGTEGVPVAPLVWEAGDCLPSQGGLSIVTLDEPSANAEVTFLETTPNTGEVTVREIGVGTATIALFEPCG